MAELIFNYEIQEEEEYDEEEQYIINQYRELAEELESM